MPQRIVLLVVFAAVLGGCSRKDRPTVVLDGWWNADYAKTSCEMAKRWYNENARLILSLGCDAVTSCPELMPRLSACAGGDPTYEVRDFEAQLGTEMAAAPECKGVRLVKFDSPNEVDETSTKAQEESHFFLMLDFNPGAKKQSWRMLHSPGSRKGGASDQYTTGEGDPKEIAHAVCAIAMRKGASLAD